MAPALKSATRKAPAAKPAAGSRAERAGAFAAGRRRSSNPLALAVLACLREKPMHPYEMASTMRERRKDESIKLNYGSLYSVIESLCKSGLIAPKETTKEGKRPERTVYGLTDAGLRELTAWLSDLLSQPVKEYLQFEAGLSLMPVLPPGTAASLLERRCAELEAELDIARNRAARSKSRGLPRLFVIERDYHMTLLAAELKWTRALAAEIQTGTLEGVDEWRSWFAGCEPEGSAAPTKG
jgi:DNA-binding PadR family transcriptional regulator